MEILWLGALLLLLFFSIYYFKDMYNPATLFLIMWSLVYFLYCLHAFGLYHADSIVLLYIMIGIFSFVAGCFLASRIKIASKYISIKSFRENFIWIIEITAVVILLFGALNNIRFIRTLGATILTIRYGDNPLMNISTPYVILRDFFAVPVVYLSIAFAFAKALSGKKFRKWLFTAILLVVLDMLALFEQACLYALAVIIVFSILYYLRKDRIDTNNLSFVKYIKWIGLIAIILVVSLFSFRKSSILQNIYIYPTGSFVCFSRKLEDFNSLGPDSPYGGFSYGFATLLGVFRPIQDVLQALGGGLQIFENTSEFYWPFLGVPVSISSQNIIYNSFVTMFMYFYKDFGVIGIIVLSFIFGMMAQNAYDNVKCNSDTYSITIYLLFVISIFTSYIQGPLTTQKFADVIYLILICRTKHRYLKWSDANYD